MTAVLLQSHLDRAAALYEAQQQELKQALERISALEETNDDLNHQLASASGDDRIDVELFATALLDEIVRETGSLHLTLPDTPAASRALLALADALGRRL